MHDINNFDLLKVNQFGFRLCRTTADAIILFKKNYDAIFSIKQNWHNAISYIWKKRRHC